MNSYEEGFTSKCAQIGVDPVALLKLAERFDPNKKYPPSKPKPKTPAPKKPEPKLPAPKKPVHKYAADDYGDALATGAGRGLAAGAGLGAGVGALGGFQSARLPSRSIPSALLKGLAGAGLGAGVGAPLGAASIGLPLAAGGAGIAALLHALFGKDKEDTLPGQSMPYTESVSSDNIDYGDTA
jgi:hypothetical protein